MDEEAVTKENLEKIINDEIDALIDFDFLSLEEKLYFMCNFFQQIDNETGLCIKHNTIEASRDCNYHLMTDGKIGTKCKVYEPIEFYVRVLLPAKQYLVENG